MSLLARVLAHPLTRGMELDDPKTTEIRRRVVLQKPFLKKIYDEWYRAILASLPGGAGRVLELGSGGGYLERHLPEVVTSDILRLTGVQVIADARALPFASDSLRAVVMVNVLHHIPDLDSFFRSASRSVRPGGAMILIEPWMSRWASWVYNNLHHESFDPDSADWSTASSGPVSGANGALAWIAFERDRGRFERQYPEWRIDRVTPMMPLRYLVSGGVSLRTLMPGWSYSLWGHLERLVEAVVGPSPMFAKIELSRRP